MKYAISQGEMTFWNKTCQMDQILWRYWTSQTGCLNSNQHLLLQRQLQSECQSSKFTLPSKT
ncbi:hypothetical protein BDL97_11G083200 [Sphagnum fallax]|nr:hypothetical protein BDL97_11G083200 [Sphagnum fallax]